MHMMTLFEQKVIVLVCGICERSDFVFITTFIYCGFLKVDFVGRNFRTEFNCIITIRYLRLPVYMVVIIQLCEFWAVCIRLALFSLRYIY